MGPRSGFERFSGHNFLLERGQKALRYLTQRGQQRLTSFVIRLLLFGGVLGLMGVLSHLHPHGDLSFYLLPITFLALPIGFIAPQETRWQKWINAVFILSFVGVFIWSGVWYFQYPEWGYRFRWFFSEGLLLAILAKVSFPKPKWEGPQQSLLSYLWMIGVVIILAALGFLSYYISQQLAPEAGTANILAGGTFVFFLALTIIRVFWLDSIRLRRANRSEHVPPQDYLLLLEWLIPRSYAFFVVLAMLLIAESMMFSTIYSAKCKKHDLESALFNQRIEASKESTYTPSPPSSKGESAIHERFLSSPAHDLFLSSRPSGGAPSPLDLSKENASQPSSPSLQSSQYQAKSPLNPILKASAPSLREVHFSEWVFFSFKPYVFPKDEAGREVDAPKWFKYLGRALLGLIFAIVLTKQLNIWKQLGALYMTLLGAARREKFKGRDEELNRQQDEMVANIKAMFDTHAPFWRWQLFHAVTAPTLNLKWRVLLDPSSAFFMGQERVQLWVMARWDMAIFAASMVILACTAPFVYLDPSLGTHFIYANAPILGGGAFIFILRVLIGLKPPKSYQFWIWWILMIHVLSALVCFFLSVNVGTRDGFWPRTLWYTELCTIGVFPALYLFGGERHRRIESFTHREQVGEQDCDYEVRVRLLRVFVQTEHRQWIAQELTQLIHPVRSGSLQLRLIIPSLLLGVLETLRVLLDRMGTFFGWATAKYSRAILLWMATQVLVWCVALLTHLFTFHRMLPDQILVAYLFNLLCLFLPHLVPLLYLCGARLKTGNSLGGLSSPSYPKSLMWLSLLGSLGGLSMWAYFFRNDPIWEETIRFSWGTVAFIPPWIPVWALRLRAKDHTLRVKGRRRQRVATAEAPFDRLAQLLKQKERDYLSSVYDSASRMKPYEQLMRHELILGCATLIESTYDRLKNGQWYEEEEHAIRRVYRQWIGGQEAIDEEAETSNELLYLQEHVMDALGSLLHDMILERDRFKVRSFQDVKVLIDSITRIALLPRPKVDDGGSAYEELVKCYQAIEALTLYILNMLHPQHQRDLAELTIDDEELEEEGQLDSILSHLSDIIDEEDGFKLKLSFPETFSDEGLDPQKERRVEDPPSLTAPSPLTLSPVVQEHLDELYTELIKLLSALQRDRAEPPLSELYVDQLPPKTLVQAASLHPFGASLIHPLLTHPDVDIARDAFDVSAFLTLPTPLALSHRSLSKVMREYDALYVISERERQEELSPIDDATSDSLLVVQSPLEMRRLNQWLTLQQGLEAAARERFDVLRSAYFNAFGYFLGLLKDRWSIAEIQSLSWHNVEDVMSSLKTLKRLNPPPMAAPLYEWVTSTFLPLQVRLMERHCRSYREWDKSYSVWRDLVQSMIDQARSDGGALWTLVWGPTYEPNSSHLLLKGIYPTSASLHQGLFHRLGRGIRLQGMDLRPVIDYYPALWLLNLLDRLTQSDGLFHPENKQDPQELLSQLSSTAQRVGQLLRPFAPEEQRIVTRMYEHLCKRLRVLKDLNQVELESLEGQGDLDFSSTLNKVNAYLDYLGSRRLRQCIYLLKLELLPSVQFLYLEGVKQSDQRELRWYHSADDSDVVVSISSDQVDEPHQGALLTSHTAEVDALDSES
jgi:hypothetical protein